LVGLSRGPTLVSCTDLSSGGQLMHKSYCTCPRCHRGKRIKMAVIAGIGGTAAVVFVLFWSMILATSNQTLDSLSAPNSELIIQTGQDGESHHAETRPETTDTPLTTSDQDEPQTNSPFEPAPATRESDKTVRNTASLNPDNIARKIHGLVNEHRIDNDIPPMEYDENLEDIAHGHSQDMAENDYFDHVNPEGDDPSQRALDAGYNCHKELVGGFYTEGIGENIAQNYTYESITYISGFPIYDWMTEDELSYGIFDQWRTSPGHNENMLEPDYDREGLGIFIDSDGEVYATENFC